MQNARFAGYHGSFHPDFRGRPGRPDDVWQHQDPLQVRVQDLERVRSESVRVEPKLQ
jgi:hypothetical protein